MEGKNIVRVQKNKDYTIINNTSICDNRLSWKAKAIHVFMLSKPDDWTFYNEEMQQWAKDGKDSFTAGLRELQKYGYVKKERRRVEGGKFDYVTIVYEVPYMDLPHTEKPSTDEPYTGKPLTENPQLLSTDIPSTESLSTDKQNTNRPTDSQSSVIDRNFKLARDFYNDNIGFATPFICEIIGHMVDENNHELVIEAMKLAVIGKAERPTQYIESILRNWRKDKITNLNKLNLHKQAKEAQQRGSNSQSYERPSNNEYDGLSL